MNCPYSKIQKPKVAFWEKLLKMLAIPFLYLFAGIIYGLTMIFNILFNGYKATKK